MTIFVFKTLKQHTKEFYDKVSEDSKKEKVKYQKRKLTAEERKKRVVENSKTQYARQKEELKASKALKKKKVPYTEEELKEKRLAGLKAVEEKRKELKASPAIPLSEILERINKVGKDKVAYDLDFPVYFIESWKLFLKGDIQNGWTPLGTKLGNQLQEYLKGVKH